MRIEKVVVEGFRAYKSKEDGTFDFLTDEGNCADLVAIYAPNGFGKSSFYDAVEWALTNNIGRYLVSSQRQNNNKTSKALNSTGEYQFILRNNQIGINDTSRVIVQTSDFHYINWVPKIKRGNRDYKFDPKDTFAGTDGFSDIFLSQDAIDGFIKEVSPEDRYKKFMQQFDVAEENYRSDLLTASNANSNRISQLKDELEKLKKAIDTPVDERIVQLVNSSLLELNETGAALELIGKKFGPEDDARLSSTINNNNISVQNRLASLDKLINEAQNLINSEQSFYIQNTEKQNISAQIIALEKKAAAAQRLRHLKSIILQAQDLLKATATEETEDSSIERALPVYFKKAEEIDANNKIKESNLKELRELDSALLEQQKKKIEAETELASNDIALSDLLELEQTAPGIFKEIASKIQAVSQLNQDTELEHHTWTEIDRENSVLISRIEWLVDIAGGTQEKVLENIEYLEISSEIEDTIHRLREDKAILIDALELAINRKENLQEHASQIARLVEFGYELIHSEKKDTCPLCKTRFDSFEELAKAVLDSGTLTAEQNEAILETARLEEDLIEHAKDEKQCFDLIVQELNARISKLKSELQIGEKDAESISKRINNSANTIKSYQLQIETLKARVLGLNESNYERYLLENRSQLTERRTTLRLLRDQAQGQIFYLTDRKNETVAKIESIERLISSLQGDPVRLYIESFSNFVKLPPEHLLQFLKARANARLELINRLNSESKEARDEISANYSDLDLELANSAAVQIEIENLKDNLRDLEFALAPYNSILVKLSITQVPEATPQDTIQSVRAEIGAMSKRRASLEIEIEKYRNLLSQIKDLEPFFRRQEARASAAKLAELLDHHGRIQEKIDTDYKQVITHLDNRVDQFFSKELINEIYTKIDPHPDFKRIEFKCDFQGENGPRLEVFLKDENDKLNAPSFHFSSAQLNILSLSIFLARAIHARNSEAPIDTILIDDPIHSMDSINILSTIDILRNISKNLNKQIIISTHDENFFRLLKKKIPEHLYNSKFIELETYGKVANGN